VFEGTIHMSTASDRVHAGANPLNRLDLSRRLVGRITDDVALVAGIGHTNFDLFAAQDRPANFYMLGSMGLAIPIALGIALAQPDRRVIALEGDGSLLMNLGCLTTVGSVNPQNLTIVLWDNGLYQITGNQTAATGVAADIAAIARGSGIERTAWVADEADFDRLIDQSLVGNGPSFIAVKVEGPPTDLRPPRDPVYIKHRFMEAINAGV
jgi:thiamine pyrophosphate-dependent acetolactate synthase large subunit-like protein